MQPLPVPNGVFRDLTIDFIKRLPKSQGKSVILVVVDKLTKYGHFMGLAHPFLVPPVAQTFLDNVYKLHGMSSSITSDKGSIFLSKFWQELFKLQDVGLQLSIIYHP